MEATEVVSTKFFKLAMSSVGVWFVAVGVVGLVSGMVAGVCVWLVILDAGLVEVLRMILLVLWLTEDGLVFPAVSELVLELASSVEPLVEVVVEAVVDGTGERVAAKLVMIAELLLGVVDEVVVGVVDEVVVGVVDEVVDEVVVGVVAERVADELVRLVRLSVELE